MSCVSHSFDKGELYTTQSQAIIKLIQKKVKDKKLISSNINVLIKTVLNLLIFFFTERFHTHKKAPKSIEKHKKHHTHKKAQKYNQPKAQKRK